MRWKRSQEDEPPEAWWHQQKRCGEDRIWRPKDRQRIRRESKRKTDFGAKVISSEHPQPDRQHAPVKRRSETVYVPRCWFNACRFKRLGDTFHLQQGSGFSKPGLARTLSAVTEKDIFRKARFKCRSPCTCRDCDVSE